MRRSFLVGISMMPVVLLLLGGACSRSDSEAPKPREPDKPQAAVPAATNAAAAVAKPADPGDPADGLKPVTLTVLCAQELRAPVEEIAQEIRASLGLDCRLECGGAPELLSRIKRMRQGDLLVVDHSDYLDEAEKEGLVKAGSGKTLAYLEPVLLVARGNPKQIKGLEDFRRVGDRKKPLTVALADPEKCALGLITQRLFAKNKIDWAAIEPRCRLKVSAEYLLILSASQHAFDLCVVRHAEAERIAAACETIAIPPKQNVISVVMTAALTCSGHPQEAQQVVDYLAGDPGKVVFKRFKYKLQVDPALLATDKPPAPPAKP